MKHSVTILFTCLVLGAFSNTAAWTDRIQFGPSAGIGLPQIPLSRFRTPVSVLGSATLRLRPFGRYFIKADASALTSFKTGTVNGRDGTLKYNLQYVTYAAGREFKRQRDASVLVFLGIGQYRLDKQIDQTLEKYDTAGLNVGLEFLNSRSSIETFLDLNWHVFFKPSSNPQLLTLTFGVLF